MENRCRLSTLSSNPKGRKFYQQCMHCGKRITLCITGGQGTVLPPPFYNALSFSNMAFSPSSARIVSISVISLAVSGAMDILASPFKK